MIIDQEFEKFVEKNKRPLLIFLVLSVLFIAGIVGSFWYATNLEVIQTQTAETTQSLIRK